MHAAIAVFWATFFVNQRGCPNRALLKPLFYYLVEKCEFMDMVDEEQKDNYLKEFTESHDSLLDMVIESIDALCDKWTESSAGLTFMEAYAKAKFILLSCLKSNTVEKTTGQGLS